MAEMTSAGAGLSREQEEEAFYHEAALNAAWTSSRLAIGVVASGLGAFVFSFFYLRSLNSYGLWYPKGFSGPAMWQGIVITGLIVVSAGAQSFGLTQLKAGKKDAWVSVAMVALALGVVSVAVQCWQLGSLAFQPGDNGYASVFAGAAPVFGALVLGTMIWLEILVMRGRQIPAISFTEQPPTFAEATEVQRFQGSLSAFTLFWNFMAVASIVLWLLFYVVH